MDLQLILDSVKETSDLSQKYFLDLGNLFPSLLNKEISPSLRNLQAVIKGLSENNEKSIASEKEIFDNSQDKYKPFLDQLNGKIETLSELDKFIAGVKEDSEQMELIALNAMVISIKSGEKGQAFSRITENLQRLSNDMFQYSDQLLAEEKQLIEHINKLKDIFSGILASQKNVSMSGNAGSQGIESIISSISVPLSTMDGDLGLIYPPIQKAMENLQLQDIIRQGLEHVTACLQEVKTQVEVPGSDEELDSVCFNIALYELCVDVLNDIINYVSKGFVEFDEKWSDVTEKLESIKSQKNNFSSRFLDETSGSGENVATRLSAVIGRFKEMMDGFNSYHLVQKDLLHVTQSINEKARTMYTVFGNLRPVMSRLHHVRILQQIEVAKNEAIKQVKDSVTDMDNLINSSNLSLDSMEKLLSVFIHEASNLLVEFNNSITKDNQSMLDLRKEKTEFFDELQITQKNLYEIIANFDVFPEGFDEKCRLVAEDLSGINNLNLKLKKCRDDLSEQVKELSAVRSRLFAAKNISEWNIKNSKFSEIINHFTITAHKEAAGKIGGFEIEHGAEQGEITFF